MRQRNIIRAAVASLLCANPMLVQAQTATADQVLNGNFNAHNVINGKSSGAPEVGAPAANQGFLNVGTSAAPIVQQSSNVGNHVSLENFDFGNVRQLATTQQTSSNEAMLSDIRDLTQTGSNTVNMIEANSIGHLDQVLEGTTQEVANTASARMMRGDLNQSGTNLANIAVARDTLLATFQNFDEASDQIVKNTLTVDGGNGRITQEGLNIGNFIDAHNVDQITRHFSGSQVVENTINVGRALRGGTIVQSGTNIANYVRATGEVSTITQTSTGAQIVRNDIHGNFGRARTTQTGINIVNLTETNGMGSGAAVSQHNSTAQVQSGQSPRASQTGNVHRSTN